MLLGGADCSEVSGSIDDAPENTPDADWLRRGLVLRKRGEREAALQCFHHAVEFRHDDVEALVNQGQIQSELGRCRDAADSFELALAFSPDCVDALLGVAEFARESGDQERALNHLQRAAQLAPSSPQPWFQMALAYNRQGNTRAALSSYERAITLDPGHLGSHINAGLIHLSQLGNAAVARQYFERAIALQPESVAAQANLGLALQEQGQFDAALAHYSRLIDAHPGVAEYQWNRGIALLSRGDWANGWRDYELRNSRSGKAGARRFPFREWDGSALTERHILVYGEQGIGDEIMFATCICEVMRQSRTTIIECDSRLAALFQRSFPAAQVHGGRRDGNRDWLTAFPQIDTQIAVGSLPRFLRQRWSDFPSHHGYLVADPVRIAYWKSRLVGLGGGIKVGICWRSGTIKTRRETRSLGVEQCLPLLGTGGCHFISLQSGDCDADLAILRQHGVEMQWWPEATRDFDEMAALIMALDLVIAVPSSVTHLAGALGKSLWVMLSTSPEWRYLWQGGQMPWYPSANLFRQSEPGQWDGVVRQLRERLESMKQRNDYV